MAMIYVPVLWLVIVSFSAVPLSGIPYPLTLANYDDLLQNPCWLPPLHAASWRR